MDPVKTVEKGPNPCAPATYVEYLTYTLSTSCLVPVEDCLTYLHRSHQHTAQRIYEGKDKLTKRSYRLRYGFSSGTLHSQFILCGIHSYYLHVLLHFRVIVASANETFGGIEGVVWVSDSLSFGWHANKTLTICCEGHN